MNFFTSDAANTNAGMQTAMLVILAFEAVLLAIVLFCLIYFSIRYHRSRHPQPRKVKESIAIEVLWTLIPIAITMVMFYYGWIGYKPFRLGGGEDNVFEVTTIGRMWQWDYVYPNGVTADDALRIPVKTPIKLIVTSVDVNHSYFIPKFRIKQDAVAGYESPMFFTANHTGKFEVYCAEYCGLQHATMLSDVIVMEQADYDAWMAEKIVETEKQKAEEEAKKAEEGEEVDIEDDESEKSQTEVSH